MYKKVTLKSYCYQECSVTMMVLLSDLMIGNKVGKYKRLTFYCYYKLNQIL